MEPVSVYKKFVIAIGVGLGLVAIFLYVPVNHSVVIMDNAWLRQMSLLVPVTKVGWEKHVKHRALMEP